MTVLLIVIIVILMLGIAVQKYYLAEQRDRIMELEDRLSEAGIEEE